MNIKAFLTAVQSDKSMKLKFITFPLLLLLISLPLYVYTFQSNLSTAGDNAAYYLLGKSLNEGTGYTNINKPEPNAASHFPPGYSFIIATTMKVTGAEVFGIKVLNGLFFLGSLLLTYFFALQLGFSSPLSFVSVIFLAFNFRMLEYSSIMMSEMPYIFFSMLILLIWSRTDLNKPLLKNLSFWVVIALIGYNYHIRTIGVALLVGIVLQMIVKKKWKYAITSVIAFVVCTLPWMIRNAMLGGGSSYGNALMRKSYYNPEEGLMGVSDFIARIFDNVIRYLGAEVPASLYGYLQISQTGSVEPLYVAIGLVSVTGIAYAMYMHARQHVYIIGYMIPFLGILMLWPTVWTGPRFILPLVPLFTLFLAWSVHQLIMLYLLKKDLTGKYGKYTPYFLLIYFPVHAGQIDTYQSSTEKYPLKYSNVFELAQWSQDSLPDDAVVACRKDQLFYVASGHKTVRFPRMSKPDDLIDFLIESNSNYLLIDPFNEDVVTKILLPAVMKHKGKFVIVKQYESPITLIAKFDATLGFTGEFKDDLRHGFGEMKYPNGDMYKGDWIEGVRNGKGLQIWVADSVQYRGFWKNDKMQGQGEMRFSDGSVFRGIWDSGVVVSLVQITTAQNQIITEPKALQLYYNKYFN